MTSQYRLVVDAAVLDVQRVGGRQLEHAGERRGWRKQVPERQIALQAAQVEIPLPRRTRGKRRQLAGKVQDAVEHRVVQGLFAQSIARDEQLATTLIEDREGEHSLEPIDARRAILLPRMNDRLGIRRRAEAMPRGFELGPERSMVVDLAVEHDPARVVLVGERLGAAGDVDDGQAAVAEAGVPAVDEAIAVWTAMGQTARHRAYRTRHLGRHDPFEGKRASHPAHLRRLLDTSSGSVRSWPRS